MQVRLYKPYNMILQFKNKIYTILIKILYSETLIYKPY